jgi:hypothetical protein
MIDFNDYPSDLFSKYIYHLNLNIYAKVINDIPTCHQFLMEMVLFNQIADNI